MPELTHAQEIFLKLRKLHPEDPDSIRAKSEAKKREDDVRRQLYIKRRRDTLTNLEVMKKAREARINKNGK